MPTSLGTLRYVPLDSFVLFLFYKESSVEEADMATTHVFVEAVADQFAACSIQQDDTKATAATGFKLFEPRLDASTAALGLSLRREQP
jgi:hypothetical protein